MTELNMKALDTQETLKPSFLSRLWQGILRFDEALNFDPQGDLARRIADLERRSKP